MKITRILLYSLIATLPTYSVGKLENVKEVELFKYFDIQVGMKGSWIDYLNQQLAQLNNAPAYKNSSSNFLFKAHPTLAQELPYVSLGTLPTPVEKLDKISEEVGIPVYIKRDDLTGGQDKDGNPWYGGNKVRKLEFLLAQALAFCAQKVLTFGCVGSNHAVATAVHARRLGLQPICMLKHQPFSHVVQHNLLMHLNQGSELHYNANNDTRKLAALWVWLEHLKKDGQVPYIIPTGGSNLFGTIGFVNAIFELKEQIKQGILPEPTYIYVPCGSCATTAGILLGCRVVGLKSQVVAIAVEPDEDPTFAQNIERLFKETNAFLHQLDESFPLVSYNGEHLKINLNFTGPDYGIFTQEGMDAAQKINDLEHIKLEGTYTAKALAGLLEEIKSKPHSVALFWDTYCGLDMSAHLKDRDYKKLPQCFHEYFDENNIQPLDHGKSMVN